MIFYNINSMIKGWFVGNIIPTAYKTNNCEVAYKTYKAGEKNESHYHKIADEITFFISGKARLNDKIAKAGDIVVVEKNEVTDFECIEDCHIVVVKVPGANGDKYRVEI